ncbi:MAG TPA: 50S ribosomal protein P1 [Candidatus Aenigmarchaeota archaeon]|nr:50S ribosomal protein P1 [Candidatus Aenigmarchaeota archaeon]
MNYVYSALLLHSAGKDISEENVKKVVSSVEQPDESKIKALVAALDGVDIADVISKAAMPTAAVAVAAAPAQEAKKEGPSEEEVEKKAEEAAGGLSLLFA